MDLHRLFLVHINKIKIKSTLGTVVRDISVATTRLVQPQHNNLWTRAATTCQALSNHVQSVHWHEDEGKWDLLWPGGPEIKSNAHAMKSEQSLVLL